MENKKETEALNITINLDLHRRLKKKIGSRKISEFVEKAITKELGEYDWKLEREQKEFQKRLIEGYERDAEGNSKEDKMWEEAGIEDNC